ncbi:unnamed protein product, partial [Phaeothamnion confervicola]
FQNAADNYVKKQQFEDACRVYERILQVDPQNKECLNVLGELYARLNIKDKAVATYRTLAELFEAEGSALDKLIGIYVGIVERNASNVSIRTRLVDHLQKQGRQQELPPHYFALATYNLERGMVDEAVKSLRRLLEIDAQHVEARELLGDIYHKRDMPTEALDEFQHVVKIYRSRGEEQKAIEFQQRLISIFPQAAD